MELEAGETLHLGQEFLGDLLEGLFMLIYTKEVLQLEVGSVLQGSLEVP